VQLLPAEVFFYDRQLHIQTHLLRPEKSLLSSYGNALDAFALEE